MNTPLRISPIHDSLQPLNGLWRDINGMPSLVSVSGEELVASHLGIADVSCLTRFGVKGAGASAWLAAQGIAVPAVPNTWNSLEGGIVARLGTTEFLIQDSLHSSVASQLTAACDQLPAKVYPVLRQDAAIVLCGSAINELLLQTCSLNFRALSLSERPVVMTSMVGVTVTIIPGDRYQIWCDGTFGAYLWRTLLAIVQELGGGAVGIDINGDRPYLR